MRADLNQRTDAKPVQSRICPGPTRTGRAKRPAQTGRRPQRAALRRWGGDFSYRVATNRYVFYGLLLLAASLVVGAITREHQELWRTAAALGIATVVIGLLHAGLDARSAEKALLLHGKTRAKKA